jgi:hypothetical protein
LKEGVGLKELGSRACIGEVSVGAGEEEVVEEWKGIRG